MNSPTPIEPTQPVLPHAPWYTSDVQVRMVLAMVAQLVSIGLRVLGHFGVSIEISAADVDAILADATQGAAIVFGVLAIVKRQKSPVAPLTFTQKAAEDLTKTKPPLLDSDPTRASKPPG